MTSPKATCIKCGSEFLQSTAESNAGYCRKCKGGINHESIAEGVELSMRLLLAFVFAFVFSGLGYGVGAVIWTGIGIILALVFFPLGFVYGFFCVEINFFLRMIFRFFLPFG